jgi:hypothetical protein
MHVPHVWIMDSHDNIHIYAYKRQPLSTFFGKYRHLIFLAFRTSSDHIQVGKPPQYSIYHPTLASNS